MWTLAFCRINTNGVLQKRRPVCFVRAASESCSRVLYILL